MIQKLQTGLIDFLRNVGPKTFNKVKPSVQTAKHYLEKHCSKNDNEFSLSPINAGPVLDATQKIDNLDATQKIAKKTSSDHYG
jgi:hypothetical protein